MNGYSAPLALKIEGEASFQGMASFTQGGSALALRVNGKTAFNRSGKASVSAGHSSVDVNLVPLGGLAGTPLCFANLTTYRPGVYVAAVRPNYPSAGKLRIYLNKKVTASIAVAWMVLN